MSAGAERTPQRGTLPPALARGARFVLQGALLVSLAAPAAATQAPTDLQQFDRFLRAAMQEWQVPGLAMAVVQGEETLFARGYGTTSLSGGGAVDEHTLFSIGSTTKAMAAAAIGLLVDEGKVSWDTPVQEVLPTFRLSDAAATARLRVRDLLTHSAGIPNTDVLWYQQDRSLDDILERMRFAPMESPPGSRFTYQNVMYAAAGKVTEVLSGQPWPEFIEQRLFAPLGMQRSVATLAKAEQRSNVATPHHFVNGAVTPIENASVDAVAAAGSVWSSVHDMALWMRFLLRGCSTEDGSALLQPQTCRELFAPQVLVGQEMYPVMRLYEHKWFTYGLGWFQTDYRGRALDFHSGSIDGLVALIGLLRSEGIGVYVLGNLDHAEVRHALLYQAFDLLDENLAANERRDWNRAVKDLFDELAAQDTGGPPPEIVSTPRPALALHRYAGTYRDALAGDIVVQPSGEALQLAWGKRRCQLQHVDSDAFRCAWEARWRGEQSLRFVVPTGPGAAPARALEMGGAEFRRLREAASEADAP